ncbi:hypothetical protein DQ04_26111000, partial [Trypanosoma grayi]|uniref:hypothetical protein n=1 Tax=Trypanosoma grayi TaxID=71804 RepID=UPI0004F49A61
LDEELDVRVRRVRVVAHHALLLLHAGEVNAHGWLVSIDGGTTSTHYTRGTTAGGVVKEGEEKCTTETQTERQTDRQTDGATQAVAHELHVAQSQTQVHTLLASAPPPKKKK